MKGYRDFPRQEDIVHESTADLRQETEIKPEKTTPTHTEETPCFSNDRTEVVVNKQNDVEPAVVRQQEVPQNNIVYEKDLATMNDDFFDEP